MLDYYVKVFIFVSKAEYAMRLVVTGFIVGNSNSTDPDNTGSAQNTQIILFKVLDLMFTWIFFHPHT